ALLEAGYDAIGVDPRAPAGPRFRQVDFREVDGEFDAVVAGRVIHHLDPLDQAVARLAYLAPLLVVDEFAWDLIDADLEAWYEAERATRPDANGPPTVEQWRWRHPGLHPHDVLLEALRARYDELVLEWIPYFHHWLGDVAVARAELRLEDLRQLAGLGQLLRDVGAADQLAADEDLRDRRPAGERG